MGKMSQEHFEQVAVVNYIKYQYPNVLFTASSGGMRTNWHQAKMNKAAGYSAGCPDILIFESRKGLHGLMIELKTKTGRLSPEQKNWLAELEKRGYKSAVAYGSDNAIAIIDIYLREGK